MNVTVCGCTVWQLSTTSAQLVATAYVHERACAHTQTLRSSSRGGSNPHKYVSLRSSVDTRAHQCVTSSVSDFQKGDVIQDPAIGNTTDTESRGLIAPVMTDTSSCSLPDNTVYTGYLTYKLLIQKLLQYHQSNQGKHIRRQQFLKKWNGPFFLKLLLLGL